MKRFCLLATGAMAIIFVQLLLNCSQPLESIEDPDPGPPGPDRVDTITLTDTVTIVDTVTQTDTVIETDTITVVDTVTILVPDSSVIQAVCSQIESNLNEIYWMFRNQEGHYLLEFEASTDWDHPSKTILIEIDGEQFLWYTDESMLFEVETDLMQNATVRMTPIDSRALGHAIDICLTVRSM